LDHNDNKPPTSDERGNRVPGEKAIIDNNTLGPAFNTPDSAKRSTVESDDTAQSAQEQQADNRTDESSRTAEEQDLVETRALAAEEPITNQNEPQTVIPKTFAEAFREARTAFGGPGGSFIWNGKTYQTNLVGEAYVANPTNVT
jgi:hypothetical protein